MAGYEDDYEDYKRAKANYDEAEGKLAAASAWLSAARHRMEMHWRKRIAEAERKAR